MGQRAQLSLKSSFSFYFLFHFCFFFSFYHLHFLPFLSTPTISSHSSSPSAVFSLSVSPHCLFFPTAHVGQAALSIQCLVSGGVLGKWESLKNKMQKGKAGVEQQTFSTFSLLGIP